MQDQVFRVLRSLRRRSLTADDALEFGVYRLAARIHDLRRLGWHIETKWEAHAGGKHARYYLRGRVGDDG